MTVFMYPPVDKSPTLGPQVCAWIESYMVYGPGDLLGQPVELDDEVRAWIYRMYELDPVYLYTRKGGRTSRSKNPSAGKRRFDRCVLSLRKGSAKTEIAAWIAAAELHHESPVRCAGFGTVRGVPNQPLGRASTDPYIPMMANSVEQSEELAYGALRRILQESSIAGDFDIGLERIMRADGTGKCEAVSATPSSRDGARTTFVHADETHRWVLPRLKDAWRTSLANLPKRPLSQPWALETTTAPEPGAGSVGEGTMEYGLQLINDPPSPPARIFFFHREASDQHDLTTREGRIAAVTEASGPYISRWSDSDRIARQWEEADADPEYLERVWLNRRVQAAARAFDIEQWKKLARIGYQPARGARISLGFDGSRYDDATGLVATELEEGYQWVAGLWQKPESAEEWEVDVTEVNSVVEALFSEYRVVRMYCDPPKWEGSIATWSGKFGEKRVVEFLTTRTLKTAHAVRAFNEAIRAGEISHDNDARFTQHVGNAVKHPTRLFDAEGERLWLIKKERPDSPFKIDLAMAGLLSWQANLDAIASGQGGRRWGVVTSNPSTGETQ